MLNVLRAGSKRTKAIWWALIVITVVTFLGGFVFLLGSGLSSGFNARASGAVGTVNNEAVSRNEFMNTVGEQRANYKRQYGSDASDRDAKMLEVQAWRSLVYQRLLSQQAKSAGMTVGDAEIVLALKTTPPPMLQNQPTFQTDGKFDYAKYQQALNDPNNNWAPFEQLMREQLPTRKFQERLLASVKVSEPELLDVFKQRFDRIDATIVQIPPDMGGEAPKVTDADLERVFAKHKGRFTASARTELEVLTVPKKYGEEEIRAAREMADGLARRARGGEDFALLARDYSEGPAADRGGVIDRAFTVKDFETSIGAKVAALAPGDVADPFQDLSRFVIIRRLPPDSTTPPEGFRIAQIVVRVRPNEEQMRAQFDQIRKWRVQASRTGLGKVAAANGLATSTTGPYDIDNTPQQLYPVPEAAEWGLTAKLKEVSQVFEGSDDYVIVQVMRQEPAGLAKRAEVEQPLRQFAEMEARVQRAKPKADAVAQALSQGRSLEEAAAQAGVQAAKASSVTRATPDPRIANAPEVVGALFGAAPGKVVGPFETVNGWFFARVDQAMAADTAAFVTSKPQLMGELLERRQRAFLGSFLAELRQKAKIEDLRSDGAN